MIELTEHEDVQRVPRTRRYRRRDFVCDSSPNIDASPHCRLGPVPLHPEAERR